MASLSREAVGDLCSLILSSCLFALGSLEVLANTMGRVINGLAVRASKQGERCEVKLPIKIGIVHIPDVTAEHSHVREGPGPRAQGAAQVLHTPMMGLER
jgi:hypothetical protein